MINASLRDSVPSIANCEPNGLVHLGGYLKMDLFLCGVFLGILCLVLMFICLTVRRKNLSALKQWFVEGLGDISGWKALLIIITVESSFFIAAFAPYLRFGDKDANVGYAALAFPCLAGLAAGGGLIFDKRDRIGADGFAYLISAILLLVAWCIFVGNARFANNIWFICIPTLVLDATAGLIFLLSKKREFTNESLFGPFFTWTGIFGGTLGFLFYGITFHAC